MPTQNRFFIVFKVPGWFFFMVPGPFLWVFKVPGWFLMVPVGFLWFFKDPRWFSIVPVRFYGFSKFQVSWFHVGFSLGHLCV